MKRWMSVGGLLAVLLTALLAGPSEVRGLDPLRSEGNVQPQGVLGTAFTYQGRLTDGGSPANGTYDFEFKLYDAVTGGTQVGSTVTKDNVTVSGGLFTVQLDFGNAFDGNARWLAIGVRPGSSTGAYTTLSPRQELTAAPYALYALNNWSLTGNSGTTAGTNFLGTTDNQALEFRVNNARALRIEPNATSPNLIGGYSGNTVTSGVVGATIGGGGQSTYTNIVTDNYGTVGGGVANSAGNGDGDTTNAPSATVGGGTFNAAIGNSATVGGGVFNTAIGDGATVPGGAGAFAGEYGQMAYASGIFVDPGDAQTSLYVMRNTTTGASWTDLYLNGTSDLLNITTGRTMAFEILVVGRTSAGESAGYRFEGVIENVGGTTAFVGAVFTGLVREDNTAWDVQVVADDPNDALVVRVLGGSTTAPVRWVAIVRTVEVSW